MIEATFTVSPAGIFGMNVLAKFLNELKRTRAISDWHPGWPESGSKRMRYTVSFSHREDAELAESRWRSAAGVRA